MATSNIFSYDAGPNVQMHFWVKHVTKAGVRQVAPTGGTNGVSGATGLDIEQTLEDLSNRITESQLFQDLGERIGLIDGPETMAGSVAARVKEEADLRAQALIQEAQSRTQALAQEAEARAAAILQEAEERIAQIEAEVAARFSADQQTLAEAKSYTYSKQESDTAIAGQLSILAAQIRGAYAGNDLSLLSSGLLFQERQARATADSAEVSARQDLSAKVLGTSNIGALTLQTLSQGLLFDERQARSTADQSEVTARQQLSAKLTGATDPSGLTLADLSSGLIFEERQARATAIGSEATSRETLAAQLRGTYTGTNPNALTQGLLYNERVARVSMDNALAQQIALLSAGAGDQFDFARIWYFDDGVEGWSTALSGREITASEGMVRVLPTGASASDPFFVSPSGLGVDGAKYTQVRARIMRIGSPPWEGAVYFSTVSDPTTSESKKKLIPAPSFDAAGVAVVTWDMPAAWLSDVITSIRIDLSGSVTASDYFEIDWVAIGRPSPGASSAQLSEEQIARASADEAEASARETLAAQVRGSYTGNSLDMVTSGLLAQEKTARATADSAEASAREALSVKLVGSANPAGASLAGITSGLLFDERQARVSADGAQVQRIETLEASAQSLSGEISGLSQAFDVVVTQVNDPGQGLSATASRLQSLESSVSSSLGSLNSALMTESATRAQADQTAANQITTIQSAIINPPVLPSDFLAGLSNWTNSRAGSPDTVSAASGTLLDDADLGRCAEITNFSSAGSNILTRGVVPAIPGKTYRITARFKITSIPADGQVRMTLVAANLSQTFTNASTNFFNQITYTSPGVYSITEQISDTSSGSVSAWAAGTKYLRCGLRLNDAETGFVLRVQSIKVEDVTDNNINRASIQTEAVTRAEQTGRLFAQYSVKVDVNGYVSGYGLSSSLNNDTPQSSFIIRADRFAVASPSGPGISPIVPFSVTTTPTIESGVTIQPGVYIDAAHIRNLAAMTARFGEAIIDGKVIAKNLTAEHLTAGDGTIGSVLKSANYLAGQQGWRVDRSGFAEFGAAVIRGQLVASQIDTRGLTIRDTSGRIILGSGQGLRQQDIAFEVVSADTPITAANASTFIANAAIGNALIGNIIQSDNYAAGMAGWRINKDGTAEFRNVIVRGDVQATSLNAATGTFTGALQAASGTFAGALTAATGTFSGTLTAQAINAVDTINIRQDAVIVPVAVRNQGAFAYSTQEGVERTISSAIIDAGGGQVIVMFSYASWSLSIGNIHRIRIKRGSDVIFERAVSTQLDSTDAVGAPFAAPIIVDRPPSGAVTYSVTVQTTNGSTSNTITDRNLVLIGAKR